MIPNQLIAEDLAIGQLGQAAGAPGRLPHLFVAVLGEFDASSSRIRRRVYTVVTHAAHAAVQLRV